LTDSDLLVDAKRSCYDKLSRKNTKNSEDAKAVPAFREEPDRPRASGEDLAILLRLAKCTTPPGRGSRTTLDPSETDKVRERSLSPSGAGGPESDSGKRAVTPVTHDAGIRPSEAPLMRRLLSILGATLGIVAGTTLATHPHAHLSIGVHAPTLAVNGPHTFRK